MKFFLLFFLFLVIESKTSRKISDCVFASHYSDSCLVYSLLNTTNLTIYSVNSPPFQLKFLPFGLVYGVYDNSPYYLSPILQSVNFSTSVYKQIFHRQNLYFSEESVLINNGCG